MPTFDEKQLAALPSDPHLREAVARDTILYPGGMDHFGGYEFGIAPYDFRDL